MSHRKHKHSAEHNPGSPRTDRERAALRGKGGAPDYQPSSGEGMTFTGEIGSRGDDTSLRGHTTPGQARREDEKRYRPPSPNPEENITG